jgi:chromosomal replication initiation ATPase DnaA
MEAHRQFARKIAARAVPDTPINLKPLPEDTEEAEAARIEEWVERQEEIHKPIDPWFSIVQVTDGPEIKPATPKVAEIQQLTAQYYRISRADLISSRRTANIVMPRQVACFLSKMLTPSSFPDIGRRFGNRDHTTILHAFKKISNLIERDEAVAADVETIKASIAEAMSCR